MCCRANLACHLDMQAYSHSWENMAKVIACTAQEEECVLFTGYQRKEIHLEMEFRNCAVIYSASSNTECGILVNGSTHRFT